MIPSDLVDLSRLQFAVTAMYHFIFVPLTLGLSFMLVAMEVTYVLTGKEIYKDMTRFWGKLFGINFALGVATGITMEFQFGTNWAYYSHYVGDIFGAPLAIEGLMAFFLESTFIGLFFFGWDRLSKGKHLAATILMAVGSNLSALWILVANAWMMNPVGAEFNFQTMRMEMVDFWAVLTNEWAQAKFVHTVAGGYMTGAIFVMAISAYYMLRRQDLQFARSSFRLAAVFGMIATLMTIQMGDESGYLVTKDQPTKIAAMEAIWETHEAPAPLTLFAIPDEAAQTNHAQIDVPWLFGLMGTRSLSTEIPGIKELTAQAEQRIVNGQKAIGVLEQLRKDPANEQLREQFLAVRDDLGFGLLLKRYAFVLVEVALGQHGFDLVRFHRHDHHVGKPRDSRGIVESEEPVGFRITVQLRPVAGACADLPGLQSPRCGKPCGQGLRHVSESDKSYLHIIIVWNNPSPRISATRHAPSSSRTRPPADSRATCPSTACRTAVQSRVAAVRNSVSAP